MSDRGAAKEGDPRVCAARVLDDVFTGRSLTDALTKPCVAATDQPFIQAMCYGVLREYPRYKLILGQLLKKPLKQSDSDLEALLQSALYQLDHMRVPPHAAVNESVQAVRRMGKKWADGLVNALLRRYLRERDQLQRKLEGNAEFQYALPGWMLRRLQQAWPERWLDVAGALTQQAGMTLRINRMKTDRKGYFAALMNEGITAWPHPCSADAVVLDKALPVDRLPGFAEGLVSVQDAGAQLAALLLDPLPGQRVLDACAAPGGKSCHLLERSGNEIALTSIDVDQARLQRVEENLQRLQLSAQCRVGDATSPREDWASGSYDRILLDAPCSASGVIRRHPDIKVLRRESDLAALVDVQQRSLNALWPLLRPGGMLLYATCSIFPEENERQVADFLADHADAVEKPIEVSWGVAREVGRQTLPGEEGMDGFYYACLQKVEP